LVRIVVRADSGFCRRLLLGWCEHNDVGYVIGVARNKRLEKLVSEQESQMQYDWQVTQVKQRAIGELRYGADSWNCQRRVISRFEYGSHGKSLSLILCKAVMR
jgi:hypothetical protein